MTSQTTRIYRLELPWSRPPLTSNMRPHWAERHRLTAEIRRSVGWLARAAHIPAADHVTVGLVWAPGDNRRRDVDNLVPTLKVAADALIDAGVVPDDTPRWMTKRMPTIQPPPGRGLWLHVESEHHTEGDT